MKTSLAISRYAKALFSLAKQNGVLEQIAAAMERLVATFRKYAAIRSILQNPAVKETEKSAFMEKILPPESPVLLKDFLKVLLEKKRLAFLEGIQEEFHRLYEKEKGILEVELLSVAPFSKDFQAKIKKLLALKLRSEIRLIPKTDASLLGGFLLRFGDREVDCSFKARFHEIEQQLLTT